MKIAILSSGILPIPAVQGGAVENLIDFYLAYNDQKKLHHITVFSTYHPAVKKHKALKSNFNQYYYIKTNSFWFKIKKRIYQEFNPKGFYYSSIELFYEHIVHQLKRDSFDLFILENRPAFALKLRKEFPQTPIITHLHTNTIHIKEPKVKEIISSTNAFIVVSEYIKKEIENVGVSAQITVVYNGIDTRLFNNHVLPIDRKSLGFDEKDFIIVFSGRLVKDKGIKELLLAIKELKEDRNIKLLVIGSEDFSKNTEQSPFILKLHEIAKSIEDKIRFTGFIPYSELPHYYATADVMVVPSHINEAFGMTCIEASAIGLPIIATNDGGIPETLIGQKHILIDKGPNMPIQIAKAINKIKNNYSDYKGNKLKPIFTKNTYASSFFEAIKELL